MNKETILIMALGDKNWIGGLYYIRNVAFQLSQNDEFREKYRLCILVNKENFDFFTVLPNQIKIIPCKISSKADFFSKISRYLNIGVVIVHNKVKFIYPNCNKIWHLLGVKGADWIADFQHRKYPEFFSKAEYEYRNAIFKKQIDSDNAIVFSSNDCENDYRKYFVSKNTKKHIYVMHFVSYIEPEINKLNDNYENLILSKYNLTKKNYICVANQFWQHKNHIIVLKALKILIEQKKTKNINFVFTGYPKDYRNKSYFDSLMSLMNDSEIKNHVQILGFMDRVEQLCVMKNSSYILQPSLFEGWGTVVEDAKVLDKLILLSDIPVHHEQKNDKCVLFNPDDPVDLAEKIIEMQKKCSKYIENISAGIKEMYHSAKEYSHSFVTMLNETFNK